MERLAREEAEQTLQAEREVMLAVQQMQQQQTVQRARAHVRPTSPLPVNSSHTKLMSRRAAIQVDAQRETAEAMSEAEAAARLLSRSGMHLSESEAVAAAACASKRASRCLSHWRGALPLPPLLSPPLLVPIRGLCGLCAAAGAAHRAVLERGSDTWRKLGQEILSLETNIDYIESMLLPEVMSEEEAEDAEGGGEEEGDAPAAGGSHRH